MREGEGEDGRPRMNNRGGWEGQGPLPPAGWRGRNRGGEWRGGRGKRPWAGGGQWRGAGVEGAGCSCSGCCLWCLGSTFTFLIWFPCTCIKPPMQRPWAKAENSNYSWVAISFLDLISKQSTSNSISLKQTNEQTNTKNYSYHDKKTFPKVYFELNSISTLLCPSGSRFKESKNSFWIQVILKSENFMCVRT
jgi:hypothetical protein